jgi:hypothetical protein
LDYQYGSPIRRGFAPGFVNYKKGCTRHAAASDKVYQLLAHGRWFSPGTPASSTTKISCLDIAEILLKVVLRTKNQSINHLLKDRSNSRTVSIILFIYITWIDVMMCIPLKLTTCDMLMITPSCLFVNRNSSSKH